MVVSLLMNTDATSFRLPLLTGLIPWRPWSHLAMDFIMTYCASTIILAVLDKLSKMCWMKPLTRLPACESLAECLFNHVFGVLWHTRRYHVQSRTPVHIKGVEGFLGNPVFWVASSIQWPDRVSKSENWSQIVLFCHWIGLESFSSLGRICPELCTAHIIKMISLPSQCVYRYQPSLFLWEIEPSNMLY